MIGTAVYKNKYNLKNIPSREVWSIDVPVNFMEYVTNLKSNTPVSSFMDVKKENGRNDFKDKICYSCVNRIQCLFNNFKNIEHDYEVSDGYSEAFKLKIYCDQYEK